MVRNLRAGLRGIASGASVLYFAREIEYLTYIDGADLCAGLRGSASGASVLYFARELYYFVSIMQREFAQCCAESARISTLTNKIK